MSKWDELSMAEKAEMIGVAVKNGITTLPEIRAKYNEFAEGGGKREVVEDNTDTQYINTMEKVAEENYKKWGFNNPDEALVHALNDNTYNYRGYYEKYSQSNANADTHWTDEFKTVYHPTFSNESIYSGKKSQYNPNGRTGGFWLTEDLFVPAPWQLFNGYKEGGSIHITPSKKGTFTAAASKHGKSVQEFASQVLAHKENYSPAMVKKANFARNAKRWKHGLGGNLFDGTTEDSQKMQIGLKVTNGWKPYTLDDILANAARIEQQKQAMEDRFSNDLMLSNDATSIANGRPQNRHLERRAVEGAKAHRAWEEEHPNLTAWGNLAGATPFIVPILAAGLPLASSAGSTIAATLQTSAPFLYNIGRIGLPWLDRAAAIYFGYEGAKDISQGKFTPSTALDVLPLVGKATSYAIKESSKIPIYRNLEKNYTGVPHNQSKDLNGNLQFYSDGSPIYMDSNFPFVHNQHTVWTSNDVDYSKLFATPDKLNQPIGTVFDVYTNPKKLSILDTPIPSEGESFYWQGLPFELKNGKISIVANIEKVPSGVAKSKDISIKKGGETGKYNQDELSSTIFRKKDVGTLNWDKNPSAIKTDDIVDFSKNHGYDAVRFHNIEDGPSLINGKWHYYPIDELVLNPNAEKFVLPHGAPKFWLWNQLPSKNLKSPSGLLPLLNYQENDE